MPLDYRYPHPLIEGRLVKRYKRFLADVTLPDGAALTVHCPNPGAMTSCSDPGSRVRISDSRNPKRKLRYTLEQVCMGRSWVCVNTQIPNAAVEQAIRRGALPQLTGYSSVRREVADGAGSRFDLLLEDEDRRCWIEVKNTSLRVGREARFPDAVTERGRKHLHALVERVKAGDRAVQLFVVSRGDVRFFRPAWEVDPDYARSLRAASDAGVELLPVRARVTARGITLHDLMPYALDADGATAGR